MTSLMAVKTYAQVLHPDISGRHLRTGTEVAADLSLIELTRRRIFGAVAAVPPAQVRLCVARLGANADFSAAARQLC